MTVWVVIDEDGIVCGVFPFEHMAQTFAHNNNIGFGNIQHTTFSTSP